MNKLYALLFVAFFSISTDAISQCTANATSYDLIVASTIVRSGNSAGYTQAYICNGGVLIDSATCCTRFVLIDSGGVLMTGPISYGAAYVLNGATFDGQNVSNNWQVFAEPNATVINHPSSAFACAQITYTASNCIMSVAQNAAPKPVVSLTGSTVNFSFSSVMTDVQIELVDVTGKVVKSEMMNQSSVHTMDIAGLASGVYMYRVMQGAEVVSTDKLVISE